MWKTRQLLTHVAENKFNTFKAYKAEVPGLFAANLREFKLNELVFAADTLARTKVHDENLWSQLCDRIRPELMKTDVHDVMKLVHSLAKVQYKKIPFLNSVDRVFLRRHQLLDSRTLTQYFIDVSRLNHLEANTFQTVIGYKTSALSDFSAFDLCFLLHIASKLQLVDTVILDAISSELIKDPAKYEHICRDIKLLSMVIRSLAFLQQRNGLFRKLIHHRLPGLIYTLGPQEMCNVLFSLVVALQDQAYTTDISAIIKVLLDRISQELKELVEIEINQLCISLFHLRSKLVPFDERYQRMLEAIVKLNLQFTPSTSKMQHKLAKLLDCMRVKHRSEERIGPYVMDYVLPQLKIAVEVNGYTHFYHNSKEFNAITKLKYQIVESLGWKVLSVNYFDWKNRSRQDKLEYLSSGITSLIGK